MAAGRRHRPGGGRNVTDIWGLNDEGSEIDRARDIAAASLGYDGNVTVRLSGGDGEVVLVAGGRARDGGQRSEGFHRELIRVIAELSDAAGTFLVRATRDETRGWQWVAEPL